jgi:CBS domain-containing protein
MLITWRRKQVKDFLNLNEPALSVASRQVLTCREDTSIKEVIDLMLSFGFRRIPVVNSRKYLKGIVTSVDILDYLCSSKPSVKRPVSTIMKKEVYTVKKTDTLEDAVRIFRRCRKGGYPVVHNKILKGIITDFDFLPNVDRKLKIRVEEAMTHKPIVLRETHTLFETAKMISKGGFRRLPVIKDDIVVGIVTPHDIIKYLNDKKELNKLRKTKVKVKSVMKKTVTSIEPHEDISKAIKIMKALKLGGLPVTEDHEIIGIITERDIMNMV